MARHRNYRNYAYEDDMSDDVYGHSVEDYDIAVSPTTAEEFLFRRSNSRDPNLSAYMADRFGRVEEEDEEESDDEPLATSQDYRRPQLDPRSEEKLSSCLDQLHSILGENLDECTAVTAVIQHNFDLERALDQILSGGMFYLSLSGISPTALSLNTLAQGSSADNSSSNDSVLRKPTIAASLSSNSNTKSVGSFNIDGVSVSEPPHTVSPPTSLSSAAVAQSHQARVSDGSEMPAQSVLLAAPLSSLSRSGGSLSVRSVTSLSVPLSHLSGLGGLPSLSESQNTDNNKLPLTLGSLLQLSQQGPLSTQPVTSSSSSLLSVPLSSLSGQLGMLSCKSRAGCLSSGCGGREGGDNLLVLSLPSVHFASVQKDPEPQIKLHHPLLNNAASNNKKEGVLDPVTPLVTALSEKASLGFSTPSTEKKKSMESSPEVPLEEDTDQAKSADTSKQRIAAKNREKEVEVQEEYDRRQRGKILLNLVVIGHVDAGKSTLMGHLLYRLGDVSKKSMHKYEMESKKAGKASFAYAWVLDETGEERERGITMDVGLTRFETETKLITLMDAPGHKDFIPNMITGAAQADVAVLVVGSSTGEFEAGFEAGGQTREHALLVRSLGVTQVIVAVNKLDNVDWSEARYNHITGKLKHFLKQAGFKESDVVYVPCSGLTGENLTGSSKEPLLRAWYNGPSLLDRIDNFKPPKRDLDKPFRFCVSDIYKGMGAGINVTGKLEAGRLHVGDKIVVMPAGEQGQVKGLSIHDEPVQLACAGDHSTLVLSGLDMMHVGLGTVLCPPRSPIKCTTKLKARILVFNVRVPITKGFMVLFHYKTLNEPATIQRLCSVLHKSTGEILQKKPRCLTKNSNAEVVIHTYKPVCVELYKDYKDLGRFMLRYSGETIAAGVVTEVGLKPFNPFWC
ncbi:unnamed protein product [Pocillopora meandrina]|uniref:Tr-type G domain-containing protein n=1 Tax=Pocillopora meandrina TaxID=46732 RepID=A0AAU9W954_9CNID|nr:unnamed protein product [Pocillopora meandrina]